MRELAGKGVGVFPFGAGATVLATAVVVEIGTFFWRGGGEAGRGDVLTHTQETNPLLYKTPPKELFLGIYLGLESGTHFLRTKLMPEYTLGV